MNDVTGSDLVLRRATVERHIERMHRVIATVAVVCILVLLFMGAAFVPFVLLKWGMAY
jgi:hypothetical protein